MSGDLTGTMGARLRSTPDGGFKLEDLRRFVAMSSSWPGDLPVYAWIAGPVGAHLRGLSIEIDPTETSKAAAEAAEWGPIEWHDRLRQALITERQACQHLSRVVGHTVGLADIKGHPVRAQILLDYVDDIGVRTGSDRS